MLLWTLLSCATGPVECDQTACPEGTQLVASQTEFRNDSITVYESTCSVLCEPIEPCYPPNVPVVSKTETSSKYECKTLEGFGSLPSVDDMDTYFGEVCQQFPPAEVLETDLGVALAGLFAADADGDGVEELLVQLSGREVAWVTGLGSSPQVSASIATQVLPRAVGDLDGDGVADLLGFESVVDDASQQIVAQLSVQYGLGDGGFAPMVGLVNMGDAQLLWLFDADGDGDNDVLAGSGSGSAVYFWSNSADNIEAVSVTSGIAHPTRFQFGDFDGDGNTDVFDSDDGVLFGGAGGLDRVTADVPAGDIAAVDLDGDGVYELAAADVVYGVSRSGDVAELDVRSALLCLPHQAQPAHFAGGVGFASLFGCWGIPVDGALLGIETPIEATLAATVVHDSDGPVLYAVSRTAPSVLLEVAP